MLKENKRTELKREFTKDIVKTVIAFANCEGGHLFIGVNDDGSVQGVIDPDALMTRVTNSLRDSIEPDLTLFTDLSFETIEEKSVLVIRVERGTARPYYLAGKGIRPEGVFVRQGTSTVPASVTAILNMIKETSGDRYEDARSLDQELSFDKVTSYFKTQHLDFGQAQMKSLHLIGKDGTFSNLALLLSDQCRHTIKVGVFEEREKRVFQDRQEFSGSLLTQLEESFNYLSRFNRRRGDFVGLVRQDRLDYPPVAIREALLNAILHRDYAFSDSTLISLFEDRLEFVTLGGLVSGITFDDIMLGVSALRNPRLGNVLYRLQLIEAYGMGLTKIRGSYQDSYTKPKIQVTDNAFKITLPNRNEMPETSGYPVRELAGFPEIVPKEERIQAIIRLFDSRERIIRKDIEEALKMSQASAILLIRDLVDRGILVREGGGKYTGYRLGNTDLK